MTEAHVERRLAAILAADIAGYSALMGADEVRTVHDLKEHQAIVLPMVGKFGGRIIDTAGDGILAEFPSVVNAVKCAIAIQSEMTERNSAVDPKHRMQFRIGINIGDIIYDDARIYGDGINVAARLEGIAEPGGISISEDAWRQVLGKVAVTFHDTGEQHLKNIARPVRTYRIELAAKSAAAPQAVPQALALPDKPSIAVLAFNNMSGDPEQEYFSDGITEDIITDLSKIGDLLVIARNSSFVYKGKPIDVKQVSRELGVRYVLEGSVRKAGSRVRVTGQLIDAANGAHIWADRFDRDLTDIFAVQDDVTKSIVDALRVKLTPTEMRRISEVPTHSTEAHDLFLRGREALLGSQSTKETFELAVRCFNRAIELDPNYAEPYVGLAHAYNRDFQNKWSGRADSKELSANFSDLALEKGPELPYAHYMAGLVKFWEGDLEGSVTAIERALSLNPNFALAIGMRGLDKVYGGPPLEAIPDLKRAFRLDPQMGHTYLHFIGTAYLLAGQFNEAIEAFNERIRRAPGTDLSRGFLISALGHLGQIDEARRVWAELRQINPRYSLPEHVARLPFRNPADADRIREGFIKADLPD